jgi:hypothetical protein
MVTAIIAMMAASTLPANTEQETGQSAFMPTQTVETLNSPQPASWLISAILLE